MKFKEAYDLPIGQHVEKKGRFAYLSWTYAVKFLRENYPEATWNIKENADGTPMFKCNKGFMVNVVVNVSGIEYPIWMPVLDNKNKPIIDPTAFDVNTSIMRGLTKAIAIATGIGLGLYAGEDLPTEGKSDGHNALYKELMEEVDNSKDVKSMEAWGKANKARVESLPADLKKKVYSLYSQIMHIHLKSEGKDGNDNA